MERTDELKERIRQQPLNDRLEESRRRIGDMCSKGRCPKMTIPVQHDDDDFYINTTLADAQATIAALQARVQELEQWVQDQSTANLETMRHTDEMQSRALEAEQQLTQRTAELEAVKADTKNMLDVATSRLREQVADLQAELERVRGELAHAKKMEAVQKEVADNQTWHVQKLRTLIAALPKVEGEIVIDRKGNGTEAGRLYAYVSTQTESYYRLHAARFTENEHADAYAALLQHRQGME